MPRRHDFHSMNFDFTTTPDRDGTGSLKWEKYGDRDILPFWLADMDFRSPPAVVEALRERAAHGVFGYTVPCAEYEQPVLRYLKRIHGIDAAPEDIVWMPGLVPALNTAARAFAGRGEAVLTCTPVYPPFLSAPEFQDRELITVPLAVEKGRYAFDFPALESAVSPAVKAFYLCNPHNPVGRIYSRTELLELLSFCERYDLVLVADEIHCDLLLDPDQPHVPALTLTERARERVIGLYAPSKTYNLPGLSCSFIVIPDRKLRARFKNAARGMITEVNCMGYVACAAAYDHGQPWLDALLPVLRANRDRLAAFVEAECPRLKMTPLDATYLAWLDARDLGLAHPARHFEDYGLGLGDGVNFGTPGWLRFTIACPPSLLEQGLERLKKAYDTATAEG